MTDGRGAHRSITRLLSAAMIAVGVALIWKAVANGGGAFSLGVIAGLLFIAAGAGRLYLTFRGR